MEKTNTLALLFIPLLALSLFTSFAIAQSNEQEDTEDIRILNLDLDLIVMMMSAWLATFLFIIAFIAYKRDKRKRLFWISFAFLLFAVKNFMLSSELFFPEIPPIIDPTAVALEFAALLSFFYGVLKK